MSEFIPCSPYHGVPLNNVNVLFLSTQMIYIQYTVQPIDTKNSFYIENFLVTMVTEGQPTLCLYIFSDFWMLGNL